MSWRAIKNITSHWELLQAVPLCQMSLKIYAGPQVFLIRSFHSHSVFALEQGRYLNKVCLLCLCSELELITICCRTTESRDFSASSFMFQLIVSALQLYVYPSHQLVISVKAARPPAKLFKPLHWKAHTASISQITQIVREGECVLCIL